MLLQVKLWKKQPGKYFCISTKSASGTWVDNWFSRNEFDKIPDFINDNRDKDIYACPHGFSSKVRQKAYALDPKLLYADLDAADPRTLELKPTIAIESSPGRFVGYWYTDLECSEQLNRRLSYSIGADVSGWDRTQVLRFPGTRNYKYDTTPRVRILWSDGPTYEVHRLEKMIPELKKVSGEEINDNASRIFKRYENKLPRWARRELIHGKPQSGKRSEVLWKLQNVLLEAGMSRDEAFDLLWVCPWNKFRDRANGVDQLWRELDKSLEQHFDSWSAKDEKEDDPTAFNPLPRSIADVEVENIDWIVPGWFARREMTIVEGDPGLGKSYFVQMIAMHLADGKYIPSETEYTPQQGRIAYFDTENTASTVTKMRLVENGIECQENYWQGEDPFSIDDPEKWNRVMEVLEDFRPIMVVFDTINIYIGGADTHKSSETQQALSEIKRIGSRFNCSVVVLRHLTKSKGSEKALYRGQGSIAFTGVARVVLTVGLSPDDSDTRVVACTKNNISKPPRSFTYRIDSLPDTPKLKNRSKLTWGDFVDLTADEIIAVIPTKNGDKETAIKWLADQLSTKDLEGSRIERMAEARGINKSTLARAAEQLGVIKKSEGFGKQKKSMWSLPDSADINAKQKPRKSQGKLKVKFGRQEAAPF